MHDVARTIDRPGSGSGVVRATRFLMRLWLEPKWAQHGICFMPCSRTFSDKATGRILRHATGPDRHCECTPKMRKWERKVQSHATWSFVSVPTFNFGWSGFAIQEG